MEEFLKLFDARDILLHVINALILLAAVTYFVYKPARKFMNERAARVKGQMDEAEALKRQAEAALGEAEAAHKAAEADVSRAQSEGATRAQASAEQILSAARQKAEETLAQALADANAMKAAAQEAIQGQALSMAVEIAEKMIGRELSQKDNDALAREFLTKVG
ncbi:MAG: hypothetical protein FWF69_07800 [Firmicutes bacterium]|nr:hypothetical protein [Bacillota bacterium]